MKIRYLGRRCRTSFFLVCSSIILAAPAPAEQSINVNGFATLAVTHESADDLRFSRSYLTNSRDNTSLLTDSIFGLQSNWRIGNRWDVFAQLVVDDNPQRSINNVIEMAFVRYRASRGISLIAGRINPNIYMLSDYKNVSHAFLWARPPIEYYAQSIIVESIDGIGINYKTDFAGGYTKIRAVYGNSITELGDNRPITIDTNDIASVSVDWSLQNVTLFASYTSAKVVLSEGDGFLDIAKAVAAVPTTILADSNTLSGRLGLEEQRAEYTSFGIKYEHYPFIVQSEVSSSSIGWLITPPTYSGYLSIGYYWKDFTPYILASFAEPKDDVFALDIPTNLDPELEGQLNILAGSVAAASGASRIDQYSLSGGVRYDLSPTIALKFQYDHFVIDSTGSGSLITPSNGETILQNKNLNLLHFSLNIVF